MTEELKKGDLVGDWVSTRWRNRIKVVLKTEADYVEVADHAGKRTVKKSDLNMVLPGFAENPLPPALIREYGLLDEK